MSLKQEIEKVRSDRENKKAYLSTLQTKLQQKVSSKFYKVLFFE